MATRNLSCAANVILHSKANLNIYSIIMRNTKLKKFESCYIGSTPIPCLYAFFIVDFVCTWNNCNSNTIILSWIFYPLLDHLFLFHLS